jgi:four helix bundle protein
MDLKIYAVELELVRIVSPLIPLLRAHSAELGDQCDRALISIPLNTAEGSYSRGRNRHAHYHVALGSAREALACLEIAQARGWLGGLESRMSDLFRQVIGTLVRLAHPTR